MASDTVLKRLGAISESLSGNSPFQRGLERETLRVDASGNLSKQPHPAPFGSKLCHPYITTDFSESQLELITPVSNSVDDTLNTLTNVLRVVHADLDNEILWSASMPCVLRGDPDIPLARYGSSNLGRLKTTYRNGLGNRYGRSMQTICAVHYNVSFSATFWKQLAAQEGKTDNAEYRTERYFDMMRNFRRFSWLPLYLFGSSPAICNSFVKGRDHNLEKFDEGSLYLPYATSLRSGNLGYQSDAQSELINICYNNLENYVQNIASAVVTPFDQYKNIQGEKDGIHAQVNDGILQSEAEFYTTIRAKRVPPKGENFLKVLLQDGVEYVEVRLLDVNPFAPLGVDGDTMRFLDTLLLYCLLAPSPKHDDALCKSVKENVDEVVYRGRHPDTTLKDNTKQRPLKEWGLEMMATLAPFASKLDGIMGGTGHVDALNTQRSKVEDSSLTPSAQILQIMRDESIPFFRFAMNQSLAHQALFKSTPPDANLRKQFEEIARLSVEQQQEIEAADSGDFDTYLRNLRQQYVDLVN